jgi:acyl carrier protein
MDDVRAHLVRLIVESSERNLSVDDLARDSGSLRTLGYSSLSYIRLIDAIENELGVYIDPDADLELFSTVDSILGMVVAGTDESGA